MPIQYGNIKTFHIKSSTFDIHQAHPNSAFRNIFPMGKGTYFKGKPKYNLHISQIACCRVRVSYHDVKVHSVIKLIGLDCIDDYELTLWDFEIENMKQCYVDLKIKYIDGYIYRARKLRWKEFYEINYNFRKEAKARHDDFNVMRYKLLNNSSYGKLLEKPHNEIFENIIDEDGIITSKVEQKKEEDCQVEAKYTYLPVGSCIPAYTRVYLTSTALKFGYKNLAYVDTDSLFLIYNDEVKKVWNSNQIDKQDHLGGWSVEHDGKLIDGAEFSCAKRYKLKIGNQSIVKMGGINFDREVMFDEINIDFNKFQVRRAYRVKGGTIIDFQEKEIKVAKKYEGIYKRNKSI